MPRAVWFPPSVALATSAPALRALLSAYRAPRVLLSLAAKGGLPLARALFGLSCDEPLASALDLFARFATPMGKRALLDACLVRDVSVGALEEGPPEELAAHVVTRAAKDARAKGVLVRGQLALAELGDARLAFEYLGREPRRAAAIPRAMEALRGSLGRWSTWSEVWIREGERGELRVAILLADDAATTLHVDPKRGPQARPHAPLRVERIRLDPSAARVTIDTDHPQDSLPVADAVGRAFFAESSFFSDRPAFTTRPLEALGTSGLAQARLPAPLTRVRVVACTKELVGEGRRSATGSGALAQLEERGDGAGGYLPEVTLRFDVAGEPMPVDVHVQLPRRFACSAPRWEPLVREAMAQLGMMAPGALVDDAWSLFPVRHPAWRLGAVLGDHEVSQLLEARALKRRVSRNVTSPDLRAQGSNLLTFAVPGEPGVSYAIPSDPSVKPRDVTERDREVLELDPAALAKLRAREMGLEGAPKVGEGGAWLVHGTLPAGGASLAFVSLLRAPASATEKKTLARRIAAEVFPAHAVLLVPEGRALDSGLLEVSYRGLVEGGKELVARAVHAARLVDDVDGWRMTDAKLVVYRAKKRVWFHRTLMDLPESGYVMVEGLAVRPKGSAPSRDLCALLSPRRQDLQAARATRPKIVKWMAARLKAAGTKVPDAEIERVIVRDGKASYRLGVTFQVF
jgi:hypothetical protein